MTETTTKIVHGYNAYTHGCRCDECKAAKAQRQRELRERHRARRRLVDEHGEGRNFVSGITHGYAGYQEFSCRCTVCTTARLERDSMRVAPPGARFTPCPDCGVRRRVTRSGEMFDHRRLAMPGQCPGSGALAKPLRAAGGL